MGDVRPLPFTVSALVLLLAACSRAGGGVEVEPVGTSSPASGGTTLTADASPSPTAGSGTLVPPSPTPPVPDPLPCGDILVPIDKEHALEPDCEPGDLVPLPAEATDGGSHLLRREAADALLRMLDAARAEGHDLYVVSAYRSYRQQEQTFQYWVSVLGETEARRTSAEPGHSEHQLGTTVDLSSATVGPDLTHIGSVAATRKPGMSAEEYIRESIVNPNAFIVPGFQPDIMPQDFGTRLTQQQINDLVTYLASLR